MSDQSSHIDIAYLAEVFEPGRLQQLSSVLGDVLRRAHLDGASSDALLPAKGSNKSRDDVVDACNSFLDRIGLQLRELEPRRYGLSSRQLRVNPDVARVDIDNDTALLEAVLLASWLLRFGPIFSLDIQSHSNIPVAFTDVVRVTLPFCTTKLEALKLRGFCFSEQNVENVLSGTACLKALQCLHLMCGHLTDKAGESLVSLLRANAGTLKSLFFGPENIPAAREITVCFKQCLALTDLELWAFPFDDHDLVELFSDYVINTDSLQRLSIMNVKQACLGSLLRALRANHSVCKAKFIVSQKQCSSAAEGVPHVLQNNTFLKKLSLNGLVPESDECSSRIFEALKTNKTLESFRIGVVDPVCAGRDEGQAVSSLLEAIEVNSTLKSLHLDWRMISNKTLKRLATALTANPTLSMLYISGPNLGDEEDTHGFREAVRNSCDRMEVEWIRAGLEELALALPESKVKKLYLNWAYERGTLPLVDVIQGLQANRTITRLHLYNINLFGHAEMAALAEYIRQTKVLKHIGMGYEIERPEYGIPLLDAFAENTSVNRVEFGIFDMDLEACEHFGAMLAKNRTLHWLVQGEEYASPEALSLVADGMKQNYTLLEFDLHLKHPSPALSRITRALAVNERRLNRAVDFVLDTIEDDYMERCVEAFRLLSQKDSLREQLIKVTGSSATDVEGLIESARKRLRSPNRD